ncbi:hypothetical protein [Pectobacterium sp. B1J-3]|uniref:hypothetical protein n=1 Tax=Pectobacterium sp. B1J-3 TaxID=3385371 RepID=UPI0039067091
MDDNKNCSYHRPLWDEDGRFHNDIIPLAGYNWSQSNVDSAALLRAYAVDPVDRSRSVYSDLSDAMVFTVRSVVKIVQQVPTP